MGSSHRENIPGFRVREFYVQLVADLRKKGFTRKATEMEQEKREISEEVKRAMLQFAQNNLYVQNLQIEILKMELGYVKARMKVSDAILNPYGTIHGGCLYSMADIVTGIAACTYGFYSSTIDGSMEYIIPAGNTEYIICESVQIRQGKHVSFYEANLYDDKGQLVDKAKFSFYMMNRPVC